MNLNSSEILNESNDIIQNFMDDSSLFVNLMNLSQLLNMSLDNTSEYIRRRQYEDAVSGVAIRDPLSIVIPITVFYSIIFFAGILGNVITCTVISRNKSMHTATNYYLFNLAISDLMLLISGMPPDIYTIWFPMSYPFNQSVCILQGLLSETSANATVLTITSFTVERYIAICHPFRQHTMSKLSRAIKFIMVIWCVAFCLAGPQAFQFGIVEDHGGKMCTVKNNFIEHAFEVSSFVFFVGPMTVICVLYVLIGVKLRKSKLLQGVKRKSCDFGRGISGQTRVIRMLIAVAVAFFLCWCPFHVQRLMAVYGSAATPSILFHRIYTVMTYVSGVLYFLSTCINPLLYNIMSHKFRDAFKSTLARQCGFGNEYQNNHTYSALSRYGGSLRLTNAAAMNNRSSPAYTNNNNNNNNGLQVGTTMMTTTTGVLGTNDNNTVGDKRDSEITLIPVSNGNTSRNPPHLARCISVSSQGTIVTSISRNDGTNSTKNQTPKRSSDGTSKDTYKFPPINDTETNGSNSEQPQLNPIAGKSTGGTLSTIAEKLRRGTKKVLHFKTTTPQSLTNLQNPKLEEKVNSVDSLHTNTISNSSLQELDEEEFTSTELAKYMAEVNNEIR